MKTTGNAKYGRCSRVQLKGAVCGNTGAANSVIGKAYIPVGTITLMWSGKGWVLCRRNKSCKNKNNGQGKKYSR
jgi:hypothetical protein